MRLSGEFSHERLVESPTGGRQQQRPARDRGRATRPQRRTARVSSPSPARRRRPCRRPSDDGLSDHSRRSCTRTSRSPSPDRPSQEAFPQRCFEDPGEDREHVDPHLARLATLRRRALRGTMPPTGRTGRKEGTMTPIVLAVLVFIALVIAVDAVRQRKIRSERAIDLRGPIAPRLAEPGPPVLTVGARHGARARADRIRRSLRHPHRVPGGRQPATALQTVRGEGLPTALGERLRDARARRP